MCSKKRLLTFHSGSTHENWMRVTHMNTSNANKSQRISANDRSMGSTANINLSRINTSKSTVSPNKKSNSLNTANTTQNTGIHASMNSSAMSPEQEFSLVMGENFRFRSTRGLPHRHSNSKLSAVRIDQNKQKRQYRQFMKKKDQENTESK